MAEKLTCADIYYCRGARTGVCDHAILLREQVKSGNLSPEAARRLLEDEKYNILPTCVLPEQLEEAIKEVSTQFGIKRLNPPRDETHRF